MRYQTLSECLYYHNVLLLDCDLNDNEVATFKHEIAHAFSKRILNGMQPLYSFEEGLASILSDEYGNVFNSSYRDTATVLKMLMEVVGTEPFYHMMTTGNIDSLKEALANIDPNVDIDQLLSDIETIYQDGGYMSYNTSQLSKENVLKRIDVDTKITSQKHGYAYFNDLFVKRHSNLLLKSAKKISFVIIGIIFVMALILYLIPEFATKTNQILMVMLPYFVFIMYCINRGQEVAQAMFMNCDHSMLTYGFYREPKVILNLFKERLKSVIFINLLPAFVLATGLVFLLFITGGTTQWIDYPILFFSILAMSIFFSVHHLVLYYLLQPYNANSETKSGTYGIANGLTYLFCYYMLKIRIPIFTFGCLTILFSILYCLISLFLVYRYAPKTFHLKN